METSFLGRLSSQPSVRSAFRAGNSIALQLFGLATTLALRMVMAAALGASTAYDAWILALLVGGMTAQLGSQTLSSALLPRISDLVAANRSAEARNLFRRAVRLAFSVSVLLALVASTVGLGFTDRYGTNFPLLLLVVVLGWGALAGVYTLRRQALNYLRQPLRGQVAGLFPIAFVLLYAVMRSGSDTLGLALAALAGFLLSVILLEYWLSKAWSPLVEQSTNAQATIPLKPLLISMIPIVLASLNSQGLSMFEQTMAASWMAGGAAVYGTALAFGRLPNMLADAAVMNVGYGKMLRAVSASRINPGENADAQLSDAFRTLIRLQTFLVFPAAAFLALFAHPTVSVLFQRGKFTPDDAAQTAAILSIMPLASLGLILQSANVQILVAWGRSAIALKFEFIAAILAVVLDLVMLRFFGLWGLPFGSALAVSIASVLTFHEVKKLTGALHWNDLGKVWIRPAIAAGCAALCGWGLGKLLLTSLPSGFPGLPRLAFVGIVQTLIFFLLAVPLRALEKFRSTPTASEIE